MKYGLIFLSILLLSNCSSSTSDSSKTEIPNTPNGLVDASKSPVESLNTNNVKTLKNKLLEVSQLIDLNCDNSNQCKIIGIGVSPCGGFANYKIYSEKKSNTKKLKESVNQFNQIMRIKNRKNKTVGICRHIEPPKTACQAKQCVSSNSSALL